MSQKNSWVSPVGYIFAMIGSAVGFANILGFSAKCYAQGGGAYLIPLMVAFLFLGIPLLVLEGVVGQTFQRPLLGAYRLTLGKLGVFLGWPTVLGVVTIGGYYSVITGWSLAYTYFAATGSIPLDTEHFFTHEFLKTTSSLFEWGNFSWLVGFFTLLVMIFTQIINGRPLAKGIEKICSFFLPLLSAILLLLFVMVCFLPGATNGFLHFLTPDFSRLMSSDIWISAFGHVFFSLSVGLGIIVGYSRYTDASINIVRSMIWVAAGDLLTSVVAGLVIFGGLGYMAELEGQSFDHVVSFSTFSLGFMIFPKIFQTLPSWLIIPAQTSFFLSLFIAGITGVFSIVESIAGNVETEFKLSRSLSVFYTVLIMSSIGLMFSFGNGPALIGAIDEMTAGVNVLCSGLFQIIAFLYASSAISSSKVWFNKRSKKRNLSFLSLKYIAPLLLLVILAFRLETEIGRELDAAAIIRWSWFLGVWLVSGFLTFRCRGFS